MKSVTFRVDGSHHLGTGHVVRCLVLARAFHKHDISPVFVTRDHESRVLALIEDHGFPVHALPSTFTLEEDATATSRLVTGNRSMFLVMDVANADYTADARRYDDYCRSLLEGIEAYSISLDDDCITELPFDMRIIPYCGADNKSVMHPGKTKWLLGPAYFIFQDEFRKAARVHRTLQGRARRILVTMGGSDPYGLTTSVLDDLRTLMPDAGMEVRVVIGPGFSSRDEQEIRKRAGAFRGACQILSASPGALAEHMIWSDLAITAGGLTKYEAAVIGTPNIILAAFPREVEMSRFFADAGAAVCLDRSRVTHDVQLAAVVQALMGDYESRARMSKRGKALVDGCGVDRILSAIPGI